MKTYLYTLGFSFSLFLGYVITDICLIGFRWYLLNETSDKSISENLKLSERDFPWLVGLLERLFFSLIVAFDVSGASIAMIGWITVKAATIPPSWIRLIREGNKEKEKTQIKNGYASLLASLVSMLFALGGGLCCKSGIQITSKTFYACEISIILVTIFYCFIKLPIVSLRNAKNRETE